jgi:hypothetical protein
MGKLRNQFPQFFRLCLFIQIFGSSVMKIFFKERIDEEDMIFSFFGY